MSILKYLPHASIDLMSEDPKECPSCQVAVLGGMTLSMCREINSKEVDCEKMAQQFIEGELSIQDLVETVRKHTTDPVTLDKLDEIEKLARGDDEGP